MATIVTKVYGSGATLSQNQEPEAKQEVSLNYGRLRYISDEYVVPAADELGVGASVNFFEMPKGARVLEMFATAGASGATGAANVGWEVSEELDENGVALEAAVAAGFYTNVQFDPGGGALARLAMAPAQSGFRKKFGAKVQVVAAVTEITATAGGTTWLLEAYIVVD